MTNPGFAQGQRDDAEGLQAQVAAIRSQVRRDLRATSLPLLLLGTATVVGELPQVVSQTWDTGVLGGGDWFTGVLVTAAFAVLWWMYRRRAFRDGVGRPAGFGAATVLGLILLSIGLVLLVLMGPFILFGAGLLMIASWQRNALLAWWAVLAGGLGVFEGFFGITNRLPASVWRIWEHPAIYLALGILTVLAGRSFPPVLPDTPERATGSHPALDLNDVVHQRTRLGILAVLAEATEADFSYLRKVLDLTDGNLGRHLEILEGAGLITISKGHHGRRPRTWAVVTAEGRGALRRELASMQALMQRIDSVISAHED